MRKRQIIGSVLVLGMGAAALLSFATAADKDGQEAAQPDKSSKERKPIDKNLSHFMRVKLDASGKILEGLAIEDFALIKEGAQKLNEMSQAEKWRVTNDALYRNFSEDFQRVTGDLVKAADERNLDRVALKWMDATMSCIECHRYARGIMIASAEPKTKVPR